MALPPHATTAISGSYAQRQHAPQPLFRWVWRCAAEPCQQVVQVFRSRVRCVADIGVVQLLLERANRARQLAASVAIHVTRALSRRGIAELLWKERHRQIPIHRRLVTRQQPKLSTNRAAAGNMKFQSPLHWGKCPAKRVVT